MESRQSASSSMNSTAKSHDRLLWAFPIALTLHNLEEAFTLPAWSQHAGALHPPVGEAEFWFALTVVTALGYAITWGSIYKGGRWTYAAMSGSVLMLLNVLFPHLLGTLLSGHYTPGVLTAVALNLPVNVWLLRRQLSRQAISWRSLSVWSVAAGGLVLAVLPALFWMGRQLSRW